jgi:hypothetical protein
MKTTSEVTIHVATSTNIDMNVDVPEMRQALRMDSSTAETKQTEKLNQKGLQRSMSISAVLSSSVDTADEKSPKGVETFWI